MGSRIESDPPRNLPAGVADRDTPGDGASPLTPSGPIASANPLEMDKAQLELQKLRGEIDDLQWKIEASRRALKRQDIEEAKLRADTADILFRTQTAPSTLRLERHRVWSTYLTIVASFLAVLASLAIAAVQYFPQQRLQLMQLARDQQFKIAQTIIELVKNLDISSSTKPSPMAQRLAALELGTLGPPAVPILIENLDLDRDPAVHEAIIRALAESIGSEAEAVNALTSLLQSFRTIFPRELNKEDPTWSILTAHVRGLGLLSTTAPRLRNELPRDFISRIFKLDSAPVNPDVPLRDVRERVVASLKDLKVSLPANAKLQRDEREKLQSDIDVQLKRIADYAK